MSINGPTYGAGPHMPFGGVKNSGNGFREPGTEALDVYCEWKTVVVNHDPRASDHDDGLRLDHAQVPETASAGSAFRSPAAPTTAAASC